MTSPNSSGSIRVESSVEPTRSQKTTVNCRSSPSTGGARSGRFLPVAAPHSGQYFARGETALPQTAHGAAASVMSLFGPYPLGQYLAGAIRSQGCAGKASYDAGARLADHGSAVAALLPQASEDSAPALRVERLVHPLDAREHVIR